MTLREQFLAELTQMQRVCVARRLPDHAEAIGMMIETFRADEALTASDADLREAFDFMRAELHAAGAVCPKGAST